MKTSKMSIENQLRWVMMDSPLTTLRDDLDAHNYSKLNSDCERLDSLTHTIDKLIYEIELKHS